MKLTELFENREVGKIDPKLIELLKSVQLFTGNYQRENSAHYAPMEAALKNFPQLAYTGPMYRCVIVLGNKGIALSTIRRNKMARGLQSWAKTKEGMQQWLADTGDVEETLTNIYLVQQGSGLDIAKLYQYASQFDLSPDAAMHLQLIKRAAAVEEVAALYNKTAQIIGTDTIEVDEDGLAL